MKKASSIKADSWLNSAGKSHVAHRKRQKTEHWPERANNTHDKPHSRGSLIPLAGFIALFTVIVVVAGYMNTLNGGWMSRNVVSIELPENGTGEYIMGRYTGMNELTQEPGTTQETGILAETGVLQEPGVLEAGNRITIEAEKQTAAEDIHLDLTETFAWISYKVKKGDSVSKIAADHALSYDAVIASNNITNARLLREGEELRLPNMDGIPYVVKKGDSLSQISKTMGVPLEAILDANNIERDIITAGETIFIPGARMKREDLKLALGELMIYPIKGARLSSPFGWRIDPIDGVRRHHAALDLAAPAGTRVSAAMDGQVIGTGFDKNLGNYVVLSHTDGFQTMYAHLTTISVANKDRVRQGIQIGTVGSTGRSTGPHLHFMVYKNGRAVNPLDFLAR